MIRQFCDYMDDFAGHTCVLLCTWPAIQYVMCDLCVLLYIAQNIGRREFGCFDQTINSYLYKLYIGIREGLITCCIGMPFTLLVK